MKKLLMLSLLLWLVTGSAGAQDLTKERWWRPDHLKVQYAGGTGFLSIGAGYQNRKQNLEGDLFYGYVPKRVGGVKIHMLTGKLTGQLLKPLTHRTFEFRPLALGLSLTYTFGPQNFLLAPEHYPYSYYGFPTALHGGLFASGQLSRHVNGARIGLYYEVGASDREIISWATNTRAIAFMEILHLAVGFRYAFVRF